MNSLHSLENKLFWQSVSCVSLSPQDNQAALVVI